MLYTVYRYIDIYGKKCYILYIDIYGEKCYILYIDI